MTGTDRLARLIARQKPGHALEQAFYNDAEIYRRDVERVFHEDWLLAGHVSELATVGAYFVFNIAGESVIVVRDAEGRVRAHVNVCRHRGSRVCLEDRGLTRQFICPYHAWTYNLDGTLAHARLMDREMDSQEFGLKPVAVEVFHGLIFISFSRNPTSFDEVARVLGPEIAVFDLARTKIAHRARYPVAANWKLLVENYNECYHCAAAHPEFSRSHSTHMTAERVAPLNRAMAERSAACGISTAIIDRFADARPAGSPDYAYNRYALFDGFETGSADGKPLSPLLGRVGGHDGGASDVYIGLLNPMLVYCDHAVIYRFIPVDAQTSVQEIIWLVHADAEEGRDYDRDRLTWLWDVTTVADKRIIEMNQEGVNSRFYTPGPYAPMEIYTQRFVSAYLDALADAATR